MGGGENAAIDSSLVVALSLRRRSVFFESEPHSFS